MWPSVSILSYTYVHTYVYEQTTENEMAGWHHCLDGRESEWTPGVGDGQGEGVGHGWATELNWSMTNLPWFMDLTFQVPMQYHSLQLRTLLLSPVTSTTGYCFCFGSGVISPLISSSILGTYWPGEFTF